MISRVRRLLSLNTGKEYPAAAEAALRFLVARNQVPQYEKLRHKLVLWLLPRSRFLAAQTMRGYRTTWQWWAPDHLLMFKQPAKDPYDALEGLP